MLIEALLLPPAVIVYVFSSIIETMLLVPLISPAAIVAIVAASVITTLSPCDNPCPICVTSIVFVPSIVLRASTESLFCIVPNTKHTTTVEETNPTIATSVSAIRNRIAFVLYESSKYAALVVKRGVNDTCALLLCDAAVVPAAPLVQPVRLLVLIPV